MIFNIFAFWFVATVNKSITVGQNRAYLREFPGYNWEIKIIREWYLEGNSIKESDRDVLKKWRSIRYLVVMSFYSNIHLIYPI